LSGVLGAIVSALVAVWVLRSTIREQRAAVGAQLWQQRQQLDEQLEHQAEHLTTQLTEAREENRRIRIHDIAAELIQSFTSLPLALREPSKYDYPSPDQARLAISLIVERMHLDLDLAEEDFYKILRKWLNNLTTHYSVLYTHGIATEDDGKRLHGYSVETGFVMQQLILWIRSKPSQRRPVTEEMEQAFEMLVKDSDAFSLRYDPKSTSPLRGRE
jgi:hypothetical protein